MRDIALLDRPLAHRGLHGPAGPENSLAAFAAAIEAGLGIELDVRLSVDGVPVVHHDTDLVRLSGTPLRVDRLSAAILRSTYLAGTDEHIPSLSEALGLVAGRVPVLLDLKVRPFALNGRAVVDALHPLLRDYAGPLAVASFDPVVLRLLRDRLPTLPRGLAAGAELESPSSRALARPMDDYWFARWARADFVTFNIARLPQPALGRFRDRGVPAIGWTFRDGWELTRAAAGFDNLIVEGPAAEIVRERGPRARVA